MEILILIAHPKAMSLTLFSARSLTASCDWRSHPKRRRVEPYGSMQKLNDKKTKSKIGPQVKPRQRANIGSGLNTKASPMVKKHGSPPCFAAEDSACRDSSKRRSVAISVIEVDPAGPRSFTSLGALNRVVPVKSTNESMSFPELSDPRLIL